MATIASYSFTHFMRAKKLNVDSAIAPFIADAASIAGATNAA